MPQNNSAIQGSAHLMTIGIPSQKSSILLLKTNSRAYSILQIDENLPIKLRISVFCLVMCIIDPLLRMTIATTTTTKK